MFKLKLFCTLAFLLILHARPVHAAVSKTADIPVSSLPATCTTGGPLYQKIVPSYGLYQCGPNNTFTLIGPSTGGSPPFADNVALVKNNSDSNKQFRVLTSGIITSNTIILTMSGTASAPVYGFGAGGFLSFGGNSLSYSNGTGPVFNDLGTGDTWGLDLSGMSNNRVVIVPDASGVMTLLGNTTTGTGSIMRASSPSVTTPTITGHVTTAGTAPSVSSCGSSPSIAGNDSAGRVTIGSGVTTTCVLTFATTWPTAPTCFANDETSILSVQSVASTTALTINAGSALTSNVINYRCVGY